VRSPVVWGYIQPTSSPTSRNRGGLDLLATEVAQDHFNLILDLHSCAYWACGTIVAPPNTGTNLAEFEPAVTAAVKRYEPSSSFWHGDSFLPTITWQVSDEVNGGYYWPNPTPASCAAFLAAALSLQARASRNQGCLRHAPARRRPPRRR
jgi:hypothetical protein